jgi:hypothetical protein
MNVKNAGAWILGAIFLIIFIFALGPAVPVWPVAAPHAVAAGSAMWNERTVEVLLQGLIILAGVMSVLMLLGSNKSRGSQP